MILPLVPLLSAVATAVGTYSLVWYHRLTADEQTEADLLAAGYARSVYCKAVEALTKSELGHIVSLVQRRIAG